MGYFKMKHDLIDDIHQAISGRRHVIWDWNGTLLNDVDHAVRVMNSILSEHHLDLIDKKRYRQIFDFPVIRYYEQLGFNFHKESFESLCHKFVDRFMDGVQNLPLIPEVKTVLTQLHAENTVQSVLSATDQVNLDAMIQHFELGSIFKYVYGIDNKFAGSKIERGHQLIEVCQIDKEETVIIGDTLHDLEVAEALGIHAVLISHGHQCHTRLKAKHNQVIECQSMT